MALFDLGFVVMTRGVAAFIEENSLRRISLQELLIRHSNGDWGELANEDKEMNDMALETGDRILSSYSLEGEKIWIITEADRSSTAIIFPSEY